MKCKFYVNFGLNERLEVLKKKKGTWDEYLGGFAGSVLSRSTPDFSGWKKQKSLNFYIILISLTKGKCIYY